VHLTTVAIVVAGYLPRRVYLKRPFGGPEQVLAYLANYTHRVAIANSRIRQIDEATGKVTITYRDWRLSLNKRD
jgi:Putative transposase